jgi:hypothetical protein
MILWGNRFESFAYTRHGRIEGSMIDEWLDIEETGRGNSKTLFALDEKNGGREAVEDRLIERVRSHYDNLEHIADDVAQLGFPGAAAILRERLPRTARARSGEMGEILATEFIEFQTEFRIPVRRLRYKDGREMALRGDDFLGVNEDEDERLYFLKGEAKSGQTVSAAVIADARERLDGDDGRPTPISLLFVADRLLEGEDEDKELGRKMRNQIATRSVRPQRITHGIFTLSRNDPADALENDLDAADGIHTHISANLKIDDHQDFIAWLYEEAENLGDD